MKDINWSSYEKNWDKMADSDNNSQEHMDKYFIDLILEKAKPSKDKTTVLDIGFGLGNYCIDLSKHSKHVTGVDVSQRLVDHCTKKINDSKIDNIEFIRKDWFSDEDCVDLNDCKFDITLSHLSPATYSFNSFKRMMDLTGKWGFVGLDMNWGNIINNELSDIAGIRGLNSCQQPLNMVNTLWHYGFYPQLKYKDMEYHNSVPEEMVFQRAMNVFAMYRGFKNDKEDEIREFIHCRANNGMVQLDEYWTTVYIFWESIER